MASASFLQSSFLGGQWSAFYQGRADSPKYGTALALCLNSYPVVEGAWTRRPGTQFNGRTRFGQPARLIPFDFNEADPYTLEFSDGHLRVWHGNILCTGPQVTVSAISTSPAAAVFTTGTPHGLATGDEVQFIMNSPGQAVAASELLNAQFNVTVDSSTTFTVSDNVSYVSISGAAIALTDGMTVAKVVDIATPYTDGAWQDLRVVTQPGQAIFLNASFAPQILTVTGFSQAAGFYQFALAAALFLDGPYQDPITQTTMVAGAGYGATTLTVGNPANIGPNGFVQSDIGRLVRLLNEPPAWVFGSTYAVGAIVSYPGQAAVTGGATTYYILNPPAGTTTSTMQDPSLNPTIWELYPQAAFWTWGTITGVTNDANVSFTFSGVAAPNFTDFTTFQMGAFSTTTGWPSCGTYHEDRLWLSGWISNRFDASATGGADNGSLNFAPTQPDGSVLDSSAISETLASGDQNYVVWMMPDHLGIICGTQAGEWLIQASTLADPLTPSSIQAHRVTKYGCANALPVRTGISIVFIQKYGRRLMEFLADVFTGRFIAPDLSETAKNLSKAGVVEVAYQEELTPIVWARCTDGSLIGATYRRVSSFTTEAPMFVGWHKHVLGSGRQVVSLVNGPTPDGKLDSLMMVTLDPTSNVYHVEVMTTLFDEDSPLTSAWFLDDAITPNVAAITSDQSGVTLYGMNHLNGKAVTAWVGGLDCGDYAVANGAITIPFGVANGYFTLNYLQLLSSQGGYTNLSVPESTHGLTFPAVVGFTYTTQAQLLRPLMPQVTGAQNGPALGKPRRIHEYSVLMNNCINGSISFGTSFQRMHVANLCSPSGVAYTPIQMVSGVHWDTMDDDSTFDGQIAWEISRPYPATILAVEGFLQTSDR